VVVVGLSVGAVTAGTISCMVRYFHSPAYAVIKHIYAIVFTVLLPVIVFIVNMIVVRKVRRAPHSAATTLGRQQHHQSTSSNSAVPTVMLITISLVYIVLNAPYAILSVFVREMKDSVPCSEKWRTLLHTATQFRWLTFGLYHFVFAYNFFVYVITGKQFRSELRHLCSSSSAAAADNNASAASVRMLTVRYTPKLSLASSNACV